MSIILGAIADDFTGATDLANNLVRAGMRCVQLIGVPQGDIDTRDVDAVVIALKSRSCPAEEAIEESLASVDWLLKKGSRQIYFKYCSTFDSTPSGNIGPVADALLERIGSKQTVMVPAFPANGRTVYQGNLFVWDKLLNESGMQNHPLTPMTDADLVRVLRHQTAHRVSGLTYSVIVEGHQAVTEKLTALSSEGVRHVICDTVDESNLEVLAEAVVKYPLVTGGSGLGQALPKQYRRQGWLEEVAEPGRLAQPQGSALVLSGSCSQTTLGQVEHFLTRYPGFALDPLKLSEGDKQFKEALEFARAHLVEGPVLIYASADPASVKAAQKVLGIKKAGELVEMTLGKLACLLVAEGVGRLLVAGGESSGAVVSALGIHQLRIGGQIDPGVPWTQSPLTDNEKYLSLALKSGNFGGRDFFTRAFDILESLSDMD